APNRRCCKGYRRSRLLDPCAGRQYRSFRNSSERASISSSVTRGWSLRPPPRFLLQTALKSYASRRITTRVPATMLLTSRATPASIIQEPVDWPRRPASPVLGGVMLPPPPP